MKREERKAILARLHDLRRRVGPLTMATEAPWDAEKTREFIRSQSGTHFEPKVVELFLSMEWEWKKRDAA